jgi:hypothetical protein
MASKHSALGQWLSYLGYAGFWGVVGLTVLASAEIAARIDDLLDENIPFLASPNERDLQFIDEHGIRGRPHGKFQKWKLNNFGFRGPDMSLEPPANCQRVMILGASESFGYYESPGMEFPAQLQRRLAKSGCFEVVNAAVVGMELASMRRYWEHWASNFHPNVVIIYPSPHFYLNESVTRRAVGEPGALRAPMTSETARFELSSRFVLRLHNVFHYPYFIQKWRNERNIARQVIGKEASWYFHSVPGDRLDMFAAELGMLLTSVQRSGATPVLMVHAFRSALPLRREDYEDLEAFRVYMPRAVPEAIALFEVAANDEIRRLATDRTLVLVDLPREIDGCRECFADLVHFTDHGAGIVADVIARQILSALHASRKPARAVQ